MNKQCSEHKFRACPFSENKNKPNFPNMNDGIDGTDIIIPCAIPYVLENPELWRFWVDYTYNDGIVKDLDNIDIVQSYIIKFFKQDIELVKEILKSGK